MNDQQTIIQEMYCHVCGHRWYPRVPTLPKACPECKSRHWNKPPTLPKGAPA